MSQKVEHVLGGVHDSGAHKLTDSSVASLVVGVYSICKASPVCHCKLFNTAIRNHNNIRWEPPNMRVNIWEKEYPHLQRINTKHFALKSIMAVALWEP